MVSYAAAMLDELMGRNRNTDPNEKPKDLNWADSEVCKYHLCSFCPHELFTNTRADLGLCNKIHDDELARNYRKSSKFMKMGYEEDFLFYLESLVSEVDRRIKRGHARLALNAAHQAQQLQGVTEAQDERIIQLTEKINVTIEKAEKLGCEGEVEQAKQLMKQCDQMKEERRLLEEFKANYAVKQNQPLNLNNSHKEMEVCPICGAFLVVGDAIQRVEEHLQGKQHLGYARVRETIDALKKRLNGEDPEREARLKKEREEREREKERERLSKDKDPDRRSREHKSSSRSKRSRSRGHRSRSRGHRSRSRGHRSRSRGDRTGSKSHRSRSRDRNAEKFGRESDRKRKSQDGRRSRSRSRDRKSSRSVDDGRSKGRDDDGSRRGGDVKRRREDSSDGSKSRDQDRKIEENKPHNHQQQPSHPPPTDKTPPSSST